MLLGADLVAGPQLAARVRRDLRRGRELAQAVEALGQHLDVPLVAQEAVVDRERRLRARARSACTEPRERGFIANAAPLISGPTSSAGKTNRSRTPGGHERLDAATVTWPM